eukprot:438095-Rhodomonas_salina.3
MRCSRADVRDGDARLPSAGGIELLGAREAKSEGRREEDKGIGGCTGRGDAGMGDRGREGKDRGRAEGKGN